MYLEIFQKPLKVLQIAGVWTDKDKSRFYTATLFLVHLFFVELSMVFTILHIFSVKSVVEFSAAMEMVPFFVEVFIKTTNISLKRKRIKKLLESLETLVADNSWIAHSGGVKLKKRIDLIARIFKTSVVLFLTTSILKAIDCVMKEKLLVMMWLPYDYENSAVLYWFSILHEIVGGIIFIPVLISCDILPNILICFATGIIDELNEKISKMLDKPIVKPKQAEASNSRVTQPQAGQQNLKRQQEEKVKELYKCIDTHLRVKGLVTEIQSIFGTIIGTQGLLSVIILCTTTFSLIFVRDCF
jgi:hypothetical protein